jgi:hypothetical protein
MEKTAFGKDSHTSRTVVPKVGEKHPPVGPLFSGCVEYFPDLSFPPVQPWRSPKKGKNFGRKKSTQIEISEASLIGNPRKSRYVLTFSDRLLFHTGCTYGAPSGQKTPFGSDSHTPRK